MLENEFVPYEQALALKELGFDEPCFAYRDGGGYLMIKQTPHCVISAPTFSQAFRWFRKEHKIHGEVMIIKGHLFTWECYEISDSKMVGVNRITAHESISSNEFKKPEEAELACLKKLIEIVKNK
jgi:hypothetical protein